MSFGGSGNDSSTSPVTTTTTTNTDNRSVLDGGSVGIGAGASNNNVNILDGGAINSAFEFASASNAIAGENYSNLLSSTSSALSGILNGIASTQNFIAGTQAEARGSLDSKTIMVLGLGVVGLIGFVMMRKKT
jgi:hypothetical protein